MPPQIAVQGSSIVGRANIECWRGTPDELASVVSALAADTEAASVSAEIVWRDGTRSRVRGPADLKRQLSEVPRLRSMCVEVRAADSAEYLARLRTLETVPGLTIEVYGSMRERVAAAVLAGFNRAMIGYVDRLASWRIALLAATTMVVPAVTSILLPANRNPWMLLVSVVATIGWLALAWLKLWPLFMVSRGCELVSEIDRRGRVRHHPRPRAERRRRVRLWLIGTVTGSIVLALLGNATFAAILALLAQLIAWLRGA